MLIYDFKRSRRLVLDSLLWIQNSDESEFKFVANTKLDGAPYLFLSCPNGNLNRIFNPAAICILNGAKRIEVEYNSLIVAAI